MERGLSLVPAGRYGAGSSPGVPITNRFVNTGTRAPSAKNVSSTVPSTGAVTSNVALSVSISATRSPSFTTSPLRRAHRAIRHSSTVLPSFGTSTGVAMLAETFHQLPTSLAELGQGPLRRAIRNEL